MICEKKEDEFNADMCRILLSIVFSAKYVQFVFSHSLKKDPALVSCSVTHKGWDSRGKVKILGQACSSHHKKIISQSQPINK